MLPRLAGTGQRRHVALTFDDGPDRVSTPRFLDLLAEREVTATFFLLGAHARREPVLVREMAAAGHELAVHGWEHDCIAMLRPGRLAGQLARSRDVVEDLTGRPVAYYRPPYGVMTAEGLYAARRAGPGDGAVVRLGGGLVPQGDAGVDRAHRQPVAAAGRHRAAPRHRPHLGAGVVATHARRDPAAAGSLGRARGAGRSARASTGEREPVRVTPLG